MKHSIKREQSHARMSFAECENVRATLKHMKLSFHLILTLALWLMAAQGAWATDPVTKTYAFSTRSLENNKSTLKMTDPDDNTSKTIITSASNYKFSNYGSDLQIGAGGQFTIYPNINGKVTRVEFTHMGRLSIMMNGSFSMSISGMTYNGNASLTGDGDYEGEGTSKITNEDASFTFVSTDAAGINGNLSMELGGMAIMLIRSGCEMKITYIPSAAPIHAHDFTYTLVGNTLTATCGGTDGDECSLTNHQISTSLTADDAFDSDPSMLFPATLTNFAPFSTETGATKGNITYVNNTTSENLGTTMPSDPGQYTASITVNAGGTGYTLTKTYNVYSYAQINNIYPQLNISTDKYASTTAAGANETVTITFTSKFGETLTTLTVTGATTNMSIGSGITSIGNNKYTFTMPAEEVNIGATFSISEDDFAVTGENEYTIKTANGWGWFCFATSYDLASDGFSGKVVKLAGNVSSSEMAGKSGHPFKGTFDGQNYTLTFNRTAAEHLSAPFHYINGATISNLHVEGLIEGGTYESLGGLVGHSEGNITINNCHVSTEISTKVSGGASHGGVIAQWNGTDATCTVTGCVYDGLIYNPNEAGVTTSCRGFIGWDYGNNGTIKFTDCLSAPAAYGTGKYALGGNCFTFVYPNSEPTLTYNMTNCYYTSILGNRQGRPAATATDAPDNLGNATTDHGMVKGYKNGFLYDGNYYTPKYGDAVVEYRFNDWNERADVTLSDRTLYKDGNWNTLCLPFSLSAAQIAANANFAGATLMTMDVTEKNGFDVEDGTLYLWFKTATEIEAGVPYLVKWEKAMDYEGNEANYDISNPVFEGVTISNSTAQTVESETTGLETVQMVGTYSPVSVTANDKSILFLGDANTLYYSTVDRQIRSCRAYFSVPYINGHAEAKARAFALSFDGEETTGILEVSANYNGVTDEAWYSLDGVRLSGKPTQRGMYINKGKKILVK
jgi:hypothetical protein